MAKENEMEFQLSKENVQSYTNGFVRHLLGG